MYSKCTEFVAATTNLIETANTATIKHWKPNKLAFEDITLSINHVNSQGNMDFHLVDKLVTKDQPHGNYKLQM